MILIGAGGHAKSCIDVLRECGIPVDGLIGLASELDTHVLGVPVIGVDGDLEGEDAGEALIALGHIKTAAPRIKAFEWLGKLGYTFPSIISPRAYVSREARLGAGTIVMHGAIVNAGALIGDNCIVNSMALIEHDALIADHCHISTGARVNGGVRIGAGSFVGSGACIKQGVELPANSFVQMGAVIT